MKEPGVAFIITIIIMGIILSPFLFVPDSLAYVGKHICNFNFYYYVFACLSMTIIMILSFAMVWLIVCSFFED